MPAPTIIDPIVVPLGQSVHIAFTDQNNQSLPTGTEAPDDCSIWPNPTGQPPMPAGLVGITYDADKRGAVLVGHATGSGWAYAKVTKGNVDIATAQFRVTVPWSVTAIGTALT